MIECWSDFAKPGLSHVWPARVSSPPLPDSRMHINCHFLIESSWILSTGTKEKVGLNTKLREMWKSFWKALSRCQKESKGYSLLRILGSTKPYLEECKLRPHFFLFKVWNKTRHWIWDTLMKEIEIMKIAVIKWNENIFPTFTSEAGGLLERSLLKLRKIFLFSLDYTEENMYVNMLHWSEMKDIFPAFSSEAEGPPDRGDS